MRPDVKMIDLLVAALLDVRGRLDEVERGRLDAQLLARAAGRVRRRSAA